MNSISSEARSRIMRSIRKVHTGPEKAVRRQLRELGAAGYRLHLRDLPGRPDIAFLRRRLAILVHGCFWHQHAGCKLAKLPSARPDYWLPKLARNRERDRASIAALEGMGWRTLVVWECELANEEELRTKLKNFLRIGSE
ncbi:DNA mismatch endonuclease Vsr [Bradyrhizobium yuanmingense]|uniref:very short patch repair endonuclease n=1 Tax=Bradyrhizobium yuanmingense TaxID=108015 RepID=UPI000FE376CD|nr:DNA mismatch endonuclease Vsr [Bradyrhizobium yuanmingense]TGN73466.1 DNA mismatch endonuclease Vsr [Bradyrhizobium yuanmingense]